MKYRRFGCWLLYWIRLTLHKLSRISKLTCVSGPLQTRIWVLVQRQVEFSIVEESTAPLAGQVRMVVEGALTCIHIHNKRKGEIKSEILRERETRRGDTHTFTEKDREKERYRE